MCAYIPWEFEENDYDENLFDKLKEKYKNQRAHILPKNQWQPLINKWLIDFPNPNMWFVLHVSPAINADIYRAALKHKGFSFRETDNINHDTPVYLETPVDGLIVDQNSLIEIVNDMENRDGVLYYRNIPAPVVDLLYRDVFEERLVYPERFN